MPHTQRRVVALALVIGLVSLGTTGLFAHDEFRFVGVVTKTDLAKNTVTMKYKEFNGKEEIVTVTLNAKTKITRDNKAVPKTELRANINVVVDALGCDDAYDAVAIKIVPAPAK
jgi:hypothetical protein